MKTPHAKTRRREARREERIMALAYWSSSRLAVTRTMAGDARGGLDPRPRLDKQLFASVFASSRLRVRRLYARRVGTGASGDSSVPPRLTPRSHQPPGL